jgi:hypothetical protein
LVLLIGAASVLGSVGGVALASKISTRALRQGFGWFVVAMASFILSQEIPPLLGYAARPATGVAIAVVAAGIVYAAHRRLYRRARLVERERLSRAATAAASGREPQGSVSRS